MSGEAASGGVPRESHVNAWARAAVLVIACTSLAILLSVDDVYAAMHRLLLDAEALVDGHPYAGAAAFVLASAVSAMIAFFSSAVLLPAAIYAWGSATTLLLLWLGWLLGGLCTYALGHGLRRPSTGPPRAGTLSRLQRYAERVPEDVTFPLALLLQLALPSELPGYLCGYLGVRFRTYVAALAIGEFVYAAGAVVLGDGAVNRQVGWVLALGVAGAMLSVVAIRLLHRRLDAGG